VSARTFKARDTVYTADGREALYVGYVGGQHIVVPIFENDDGPQQSDYPESHNVVFADPPADKYHEESAAAKKQLEATRMDLQKAQTELRQARADRADLMAEIIKHPDLAPIAEFMAGTLTHVALIPNYGDSIKIVPIGEAVTPREASSQRSGEIRLLALYGGWTGPNGTTGWSRDDFRWRLNEYRDGSGSAQPCILGTSEANVLERLQAYLDANWAKTGVHASHTLVGWARSAMRMGLNVPETLRTTVEKEDAAYAESARKRAIEDLQRAEKTLAEARAKVEEITPAGVA
jgi:hypothetical protein